MRTSQVVYLKVVSILAFLDIMVCCYGMSKMIHRTTFALDETTTKRLKRLAVRWKVSQAEVVRRSLEKMEQMDKVYRMNPVQQLWQLHEDGNGLSEEQAKAWCEEILKTRGEWRRE